MNTNLIPTPRVDKNGRTVVRHMKQETQGTKSEALSRVSPHAPKPKKTVEELASDVCDLVAAMISECGEHDSVEFDEWQYEKLRSEDDEEHLQRVHELLTEVANERPELIPSVMYRLADLGDFSKTMIKAVYAHRDEFYREPEDCNRIALYYASLTRSHGIEPDPVTKRVESLSAHLKADVHYAAQHDCPANDYLRNKAYVQTVEKNAHRIDSLLEYRDQFPIAYDKDAHDQMEVADNFDPALFEEYLSKGVIKDGFL